MKYFQVFLFFATLTIFISCSPTKKAQPVVSQTAHGFHLPDSLSSLPASDIDLQLKIAAPAILAKIDSIVPKEFLSDHWPNYSQPSCDFRYKYRFVRSGLNISCINNKVTIQFIGNYQLAGSKCLCAGNRPVSPWVSGSCGYGNESLRRISINVSSLLYFLPNYKLRSDTKLDNLLSMDKCVVSMFSNDVTSLVADSVRSSVNAFCNSFDKAIAGMDFSKIINGALERAYASTPISNYGFVSINPTAIRVGKLSYYKDSFYISVGATCRPELSSDSIPKSNHLSMPLLNAGENRNGVSLYLTADYDYGFLSKILNDSLRNKVFDFNGRTVVIREANINGIGDHRIEVMVDFSGSNKGRVYLRGTPVLDVANQTLTVPDISYSLEGEDLALKIAKTIFRNKIRKNLQGKSYLDIGALLKSSFPMLDSKLNNQLASHIFTSGKFNDIKIIGLLAQKNSIQMQVYTNANISIIGTGLGW
ncbi:MAG: DUF4403 family protein [Bacteroidetes bacterium]|nr:DUF4403 family protein [Bacteroidota bacterium]